MHISVTSMHIFYLTAYIFSLCPGVGISLGYKFKGYGNYLQPKIYDKIAATDTKCKCSVISFSLH
jgi:hypothetical protein